MLCSLPGPAALSIAGPVGDVLYDAPLLWILAYSAWNWAFISRRTPPLSAVHAAVLGAALLCAAWTPAQWGQARAFTLAAHQLLAFGLWDRYPALWMAPRPVPRRASAASGLLAVLLGLACTLAAHGVSLDRLVR